MARGSALLAAAQEVTEAADESSAAYTASAPFDLHPAIERASLHLRRPDLAALYKAIADAFGVRLVMDTDIRPVRPPSDFTLDDVTLKQALDAAGNITHTFVAPLDEHTGIVASDTAEKRGAYERQIMGTFRMDGATTPQELTEMSTLLRTIVDLRRVAQDSRSNGITVLGRANQVSAARQVLGGLQMGRGEVVLEMDILEVDSQRARQLGVLPPQPFQLLFVGLAGASLTTPGSVLIPALHTGAALFGVQLPGATAILTYNSSAVRSYQRLHLRALDGQQGSLLLGERYPILNGFVSNSFFPTQGSTTGNAVAASGFFPSVQYEDLGVTVKATPYLHSGRELTLKLDLALRGLSSENLNGAPIITNRQVTEQFRMRDGETYVIGGILSRERDASVNGYPVLARLPLLGALFATHNKQQTETEMLLVIRPHIVRSAPAELYASNSIYFGKELLGLPAAPALPPPPPQPQPGLPQPGQPQPGQPPFVPGAVPPNQLPNQPGVPPNIQQPGQPQQIYPQQPGQPQQIYPQPGQPPFQPFVPGVVPGVPPQQNQPGQPPQQQQPQQQ
jgi:hypothetical protein